MVTGFLQAAWPVLAGVAVRVTPLFLTALLADRILRRRSATLRHAVWRATLAGTMAVGIGAAVLPAWRLAVLPPRAPQVTTADAPVRRAAAISAISAAAISAAEARRADAGDAPAAPPHTVPVTAWLVALWLAVSCGMGLRFALDLGALVRSSRRARPVRGGPVAALTESIAQDLGIMRPVRVLLHDGAIIPHTFGLWRPTLALPRDAGTWPHDRLMRVITHELGHVQRGDALECVLVRSVLAMLWFHPGAWLLARRLAETREAACDDIVLLRGARASDYATDLLQAVHTARAARLPAAVPAMARRTELAARLTDILDATRLRQLDAGTPRRLMGVALVVIALPLAAVQPVARLSPGAGDARVRAATTAERAVPTTLPAIQPLSGRAAPAAVVRPAVRARERAPSPPRLSIIAARLATLDSICTVTNGRTRGELLVALADHWVEDARFRAAYFRVLDGIPDARVRADVVVHALTVSRTSPTRELARTIIDGFPDRGLRDAMADHLRQADGSRPAQRPTTD